MGCGTRHQFAIGQNNKEEVEEEKNILEWGEKSLRDKDGEISFGGWHDKLRVAGLPYIVLKQYCVHFHVDLRRRCKDVSGEHELASRYHARVISMRKKTNVLPSTSSFPFLSYVYTLYDTNDFVKIIITICSSTLNHDAHIVTESRCMKAWWEL